MKAATGDGRDWNGVALNGVIHGFNEPNCRLDACRHKWVEVCKSGFDLFSRYTKDDTVRFCQHAYSARQSAQDGNLAED